ncbi:DNA-binding response regulator [Clostridia bacterium]|nr:DNA-binding response regulator [Clostridia bacterium]
MNNNFQLSSLNSKLILCVEDEPFILENHRKILTDAGYNVICAENLKQAEAHLSGQSPDAIVLDIMLPDGNGLDLLKRLRSEGSRVPILMLTAWGKASDVARGLKLGANDYISKPFEYTVLLARIEAMFRNMEYVPETIVKGLLTLNIVAGQAFLNGTDMLLTQKEFALLLLFVQNEERAINAEYLYEKVWGVPMSGDSQAVTSAVSRLRKKLVGSGYGIYAERNEGYIFWRE